MIKSEDLKITTLSENSVASTVMNAEWGLSILVEAGEQKILLDAGGGNTAAQNAHRLGADLGLIDTIVLSHSHSDHTLGLVPVLSSTKDDIPVLAHPEVWDLKYARNKRTGKYYFLGIPYRKEYLESIGARFELSADPQWITPDICTSGEESMTTEYEQIPDTLFKKIDDRYVPDAIADDLSLFIRTELGLVIVLGCAHRGVINVIRHAQTVMDTDTIYMVVGGTHLFTADDHRLERTIADLRDIGVVWLGVSHCTGFKASAALSMAFPDSFFTNNAGTVIEFPFER